ncbi:MAG: gamma-glutamyltransferase, partial [Chloroflexi bacterium]|nr:gamma-glutamyltransferase [Chloroflexota bacterium]
MKANYNEGKWGYVLGTVSAKGAYSADEVIKAAGNDTLTADQAKLIKARALIHVFIQDKLAASADASNDPDVAKALKLIRELFGKDYILNWMNVEMMASIADYFYLIKNYPAAFEAYDYLLNYANFESLNASHRQYIRLWVEMRLQLDDMKTSDAYIKYAKKKEVKVLSGLGRAPLDPKAIEWFYANGIPARGDMKAAPTPGCVDLCVTLLRLYGTKSFADAVAPTLSLLDHGTEK